MANTSTSPIKPDRFGYAEAQHLLNRAGFGGSSRQIQTLASMGPADAVDTLIDFPSTTDLPKPDIDPDVMRPLTDAERRERNRANRNGDEETLARFRAMRQTAQGADRRQFANLQQWWVDRMITTPAPMQEKLTLLWHGHFAVNYRGCEDAYLIYQQNELFRQNANTSFARLAAGIVRDPAMLVFLNNDRNLKSRPNENLARELMELFTLGVGQYTENDIKQGARALTGYTRNDNDFRFNSGQHDTGNKTILGKTGPFNGDQFVNICLAQNACPQFIAFKIYKHFVADVAKPNDADPDQKRVILKIAADLRRRDYDLKPVLRRLLLSEHFYDPSVRGTKIKSPVELTVGTIRALATPQRSGRLLLDALRMMGQEPLNPPNVAGWPGGRTWINTSTLFIRQNLATYLITGKPPFDTGWTRKQINYDATALIEDIKNPTPQAVVDRLLALLLGGAARPENRAALLAFLKDHNNRITNDTLIALLCLITAMPEYQLC